MGNHQVSSSASLRASLNRRLFERYHKIHLNLRSIL